MLWPNPADAQYRTNSCLPYTHRPAMMDLAGPTAYSPRRERGSDRDRETVRHRDRDRDRETERKRDREKERQREKEREGQRERETERK